MALARENVGRITKKIITHLLRQYSVPAYYKLIRINLAIILASWTNKPMGLDLNFSLRKPTIIPIRLHLQSAF